MSKLNKIFLLITFSCNVTFATFTLSGGVITQSGTDANLSGLSGIAGVTVQNITGTIYPISIYTLSNVKLKITGNLTMGSREKIIFTSQNASDNILEIDNGVFNIGEKYLKNGFTSQLPVEAIVWALSSSGSWNTKVLVVKNSGKLIANNVIFRIPHSIWFEQNTNGEVTLDDCIIDKRGSIGDIQTNHAGSGNNNTTIKNSRIYADGQSGLTFRNSNPPTIENVAIYQARDAWNNESGSPKTIRGLVPDVGTNADVSQWGGNQTTVINARKGIQFNWGGHLENSNSNTGSIGVWQELNLNFKLSNGQPVNEVAFYLTDNVLAADNNHTSLVNPFGVTINPFTRQVYTAFSNSSGNIPLQTILIGAGSRASGGIQIAGGNSNRIRPRGKFTTTTLDANDDVFDYTVWSYDHLSQTNPIALKGGSLGNSIQETVILAKDFNVTLPKNSAASLTGINISHNPKRITITSPITLCDLYDFAKYNKLFNLESPSIQELCTNPNEKTLEIGNYQILLESNSKLLPCDKFEKIKSNVSSVISNPDLNVEVSLQDSNGTYKLIRLQNIVSGKVTIKDNNTNTILKQVNNYTGNINLAVLSNSNNVSVLVERVGYTNWGTNINLTTADIFSYVVVQTNGFGDPATLENQLLELYLLKKILMKNEAIYNSLNNPVNAEINETFINQTITTTATIEKQQEFLELLKKILKKTTAIRETLDKR